MSFAGLPKYNEFGVVLFDTKDPAPITQFFSITIFGKIIDPEPIKTFNFAFDLPQRIDPGPT